MLHHFHSLDTLPNAKVLIVFVYELGYNESSRQITHQKPFLWGMLKIFRA